MPKPSVLILRAPGTNCDLETAYAFERAGAVTQRVHIHALLKDPAQTRRHQVLCLPGGFSYGDDIAAGRILGNQIRFHRELADCLDEFKSAGKLVLGICNGFQILIKSGILLPPDADGVYPATLTWNQSGRFEDRWVRLAVERGPCAFFAGIQSMYLPVAHAEGRFITRDAATLDRLVKAGQVTLRYTDGTNPNGAQADIAGICDETGRVCGLMPHPERHIDRTHHPRWTRGEGAAEGDGLQVFRNAVKYFQ
jgi:phosphoribosylformylglycinamidine synthase subunit PurQ / glutaminase